jgi:hypothetical protein
MLRKTVIGACFAAIAASSAPAFALNPQPLPPGPPPCHCDSPSRYKNHYYWKYMLRRQYLIKQQILKQQLQLKIQQQKLVVR